ncbi:MAG: 2-oxoacid:acceptor oxidoreductase subunit alpha [Sphaerochaeta sp.]
MERQSYSIVLSAEAGQGLQTIESLFISLLQKSGYHAFIAKELMSRVRGGNNTSEIRIAPKPVQAFVGRIDVLIVLSKDGLDRLLDRIDGDTLIIGEEDYITAQKTDARLYAVNVKEQMEKLRSQLYTNTFFIGVLSTLFSCDESIAHSLLSEQFSRKGEDIVKNNIKAFDFGKGAAEKSDYHFSVKRDETVTTMKAIKGFETIGIGALSGGCNFLASYPMSPATSVMVYLASHERSHSVLVEQAEDEIAAINMALGAWYAGARAMVTTSGGGFALMSEGISLSGITETPVVVHLAQRPGPGTGLPTRTEQGDLNLALYSGHGDFPRVILAPGTWEDGVLLTHKAFEIADAYQIPVFVLTDQYYLDGEGIMEKVDFSKLERTNHVVRSESTYKRYKITDSGISERAIPGQGKGFVCVDSDEHTEDGRITESAAVRQTMMDKRMRKLSAYQDIEPRIIGDENSDTLVVGWGSTYGAIEEAVENLDDDSLAFAFFPQVYPLPSSTKEILEKAKHLILVENNASAQFGQLIRRELGITFDTTILQYNGSPFSVEQLVERIGEVLA